MSSVKRRLTTGIPGTPPQPELQPSPSTSTSPVPTVDPEQALNALEQARPRGPDAPSSSALTTQDAPAAGGGMLGLLRNLLGSRRSTTATATPARPAAPTLRQVVVGARGYSKLDPADQALLTRMLEHSSPLASQQRAALQRLVHTQDWADMTATQQKDALLEHTRPFKTKLGLEASKAWSVLPQQTRESMIARLNQPGSEHFADVVGRMVETRGFAGRDAAEQAKLLVQQQPLTTVPARPEDPGTRAAQRTLRAQPAAAGLDATTHQRLDTLLAGAHNPYAARARSELKKRTADPVYAVMTRAEQTAYLGEIAEGTTAAPKQIINLSANARRPARHRLTSAGQPDGHKFVGATRDATEHRAQIGARSVPIFSARGEPVAGQSSPAEMAQALATLPPEVLSVVKKVVINPVRNPGDAYWEKTFNMKGFRAAATASQDGAINVFPSAGDARSVQTQSGYLAHEAGHLIAYEAFGKQVGGPGWQRYQQAVRRDGITPSKYATGNVNEDFAETMQLYLTHRGRGDFDELRQLFPARFAVIDEVLASRQAALGAARRPQ